MGLEIINLFKRGISKLQFSLIFLSFLLITFTSVFATLQSDQIFIDSNSQTVTSQLIIHSRSNHEVVSETKNNINVTWFPVFIGLVDKEYNLTIQNLENIERSIDISGFFKAITGGVDNILPGSIKLSYLTICNPFLQMLFQSNCQIL